MEIKQIAIIMSQSQKRKENQTYPYMLNGTTDCIVKQVVEMTQSGIEPIPQDHYTNGVNVLCNSI